MLPTLPTLPIYLVIGAENSPYSIKVRSYFRYKGIPHAWLKRSQAQEQYKQYAKLPLVPLVVTPDGQGLQDSTPIIEDMEQRVPAPAVQPEDAVSAFVSVLLEEFADEWGNKWMFHYRWARDVDQIAASRRLVVDGAPGISDEALSTSAAAIRERMVPRVWFVGANEITAPQIERSFVDVLAQLAQHLATRGFLFGARPALADFALWGQLYNAAKDPTPGAIIARHPAVTAWLARMVDPTSDGAFEPWAALAPTLAPLLRDQVAALFLPWSDANARAVTANAETFDVQLKGERWTQKPQKYHARSLGELRRKYAAVANDIALRPVLEDTGCLPLLIA